jgi:hypothetical protein
MPLANQLVSCSCSYEQSKPILLAIHYIRCLEDASSVKLGAKPGFSTNSMISCRFFDRNFNLPAELTSKMLCQ